MQQNGTQNSDTAPDSGLTGRYSTNAGFSEVASAVSALTADELLGLSDSLGATDGWDSDCGAGDVGSAFLSNLF